MTGADEAAKIEAYRRSKELVEVARTAELPSPPLGLVVAGTPEPDARMIAARIGETAERFLKFPLPLKTVIPAMGPDPSGSSAGAWHDFEVGPTYGTERLVAELRRAAMDRDSAIDEVSLEVPEPEVIETASSSAAQTDELLASLGDEIEATPIPDELSGVLEPLPPAPASMPDELELQELHDERRALEERFEPVASPGPEVGTEPAVLATDSATLVLEEEGRPQESCERALEPQDRYCSLIPGLTLIDLPCPVHQRIELALDEDHHLHLVAHESSLRSLRSAEAWAITNRTLLEAVLPGLAPFEDRGIRLDLLVEDAAEASDLQKTGLLLHLLVGAGEQRQTLALNNHRSAFNLG